MEDQEPTGGVTRRKLIASASAAGAAVWASPLLTPVAKAQGQPGSPEPVCAPGRCYCTTTTEGGLTCGCFDRGDCANYQSCTASSQCASGEVCAPGGDCCGGICLALCSTTCENPIDSCNGADANCGPDAQAVEHAVAGQPPHG